MPRANNAKRATAKFVLAIELERERTQRANAKIPRNRCATGNHRNTTAERRGRTVANGNRRGDRPAPFPASAGKTQPRKICIKNLRLAARAHVANAIRERHALELPSPRPTKNAAATETITEGSHMLVKSLRRREPQRPTITPNTRGRPEHDKRTRKR